MKVEEYKPERELMTIIGFTDEDLEANREGYLSKKQRARLSQKRTLFQRTALVLVGVATALCVVIIFRQVLASTLPEKLMLTLMICLGTAALTLLFWWQWNQINHDLYKGYVNAAEGWLSLFKTLNERNNLYHYWVEVNNARFGVSGEAFAAFQKFQQEEPYCAIYYTPFSKTLLSVEPSGNPKAEK